LNLDTSEDVDKISTNPEDLVVDASINRQEVISNEMKEDKMKLQEAKANKMSEIEDLKINSINMKMKKGN